MIAYLLYIPCMLQQKASFCSQSDWVSSKCVPIFFPSFVCTRFPPARLQSCIQYARLVCTTALRQSCIVCVCYRKLSYIFHSDNIRMHEWALNPFSIAGIKVTARSQRRKQITLKHAVHLLHCCLWTSLIQLRCLHWLVSRFIHSVKNVANYDDEAVVNTHTQTVRGRRFVVKTMFWVAFSDCNVYLNATFHPLWFR